MRDLGMIAVDEPFTNLLTQGMVCMETRSCPEHGWLYPEEVVDDRCSRCAAEVVVGRNEKMSKSKKNVIDPDGLIARYGADTARLFTLFAAPPEKGLEWNEQGVEGASRFLHRVWRLVGDHLALVQGVPAVDAGQLDESARELRRQVHRTIRKVTDDIDGRFQFNTAIAALMELCNAVHEYNQPREDGQGPAPDRAVVSEIAECMTLLLAPFTPHMADELWSTLGKPGTTYHAQWPAHDESVAAVNEITLVVQVNGKLRDRITVPANTVNKELERIALESNKIKEAIKSSTLVKVLVVKGKLVNIVVSR